MRNQVNWCYWKAILCSAILVLHLATLGSFAQQPSSRDQEAREHLRRAKSLSSYGDPRAEEEYRVAIKLGGNRYPQAYLELSRFIARRSSRFLEAADLLEAYIKETMWKNHTEEMKNLNNLREAATLQNKAQLFEPLELEEFLRLATLTRAYGRAEDAVAVLEKSVELYPTSSKALLRLASTLKITDKDRILALLYRAIQVDSDNAETHTEAGWLFFTLVRRIDEAIEQFYKAIHLSSGNNVDAWRGLAYTLPYRGKRKEAIEAFENYRRLRKAPSVGDEDLRLRIERLRKDKG